MTNWWGGEMIVFPNAKINLGLNVVARRPDGFHDIETVFYPVGLYDALEIIGTEEGVTEFSASGIPVPGNPAENLCMKAKELFFSFTRYQRSQSPPPHSPPLRNIPKQALHIHLHKMIPAGSGLGGGSSDGAFTLKLLNELFGNPLSDKELIGLACRLGSDCAFFLKDRPVFATGRGEIFEPVEVDLSGYRIEFAFPPVHVSTREAYAMVIPRKPSRSVREIILQPVETWKDHLANDFEESVFKKYPEIEIMKEKLYKKGALYASMTGSGSAVFGIFPLAHDTP